VERAVFLDAVARPRHELVDAPARPGHADDRDVEAPALHHRVQRREDLLEGEVAGDAEEHQRIRARRGPAFSTVPPNPSRMADSTLFWKSASPRELKRA